MIFVKEKSIISKESAFPPAAAAAAAAGNNLPREQAPVQSRAQEVH